MQFYLAIGLIVLFFGQRGLWVVWPACLAITAQDKRGERIFIFKLICAAMKFLSELVGDDLPEHVEWQARTLLYSFGGCGITLLVYFKQSIFRLGPVFTALRNGITSCLTLTLGGSAIVTFPLLATDAIRRHHFLCSLRHPPTHDPRMVE